MISGKFRVRARLLEQLGEQLIKNESIALIELVKNAYDADATEVNIKMQDTDKENGKIIIEDNGCGMDLNIIQNVWLEPGTDYKKKMIEEKKYTPIFNRKPLGEKGIGRFAVHKLGKQIELISRQRDKKEIFLKINWNKFSDFTYLEELPVEIYEREPEIFNQNNTGTKIIITDLRKKWNREDIRTLYRSIQAFNNPFKNISNFKVNFDFDKKEWLEGLLNINELIDYALFYVYAEIEGNIIQKFEYEFRPYPGMTKLKKRKITETDNSIKKILRMVDSKNNDINLSNFNIGPIKFTAYIFDRESKILRLGLSDIKGLKEYLDLNGGIRVYRDGIRIYDYGEPENDWLELDIRRVNVPAKKISNNLILASVELDREKSTDLIEKANREGFIENEAYFAFKSAILYLLNVIENQRNIDKDKIRKFYGSKEQSQPVINSINDLKGIIEEKIHEESTKTEILKYLNRIEKEYEKISETLLKSAGAGLNLSVAIHEMEKILSELKRIIEKEKINERIITLVKHLASLVDGYAALIRSSGRKKEDITKILQQALFNMELRLQYHNITLIKEFENYRGNKNITLARNLVLSSIMNIIDNSIWWLDYSKKGSDENKMIYINLIDKPEGYLSIIIADNGCGFAISSEEAVKPFVTAKPDGMGLGLHIVSEVMKAHQGLLLFSENIDPKEFDIPDEFTKGAILILCFKKGE